MALYEIKINYFNCENGDDTTLLKRKARYPEEALWKLCEQYGWTFNSLFDHVSMSGNIFSLNRLGESNLRPFAIAGVTRCVNKEDYPVEQFFTRESFDFELPDNWKECVDWLNTYTVDIIVDNKLDAESAALLIPIIWADFCNEWLDGSPDMKYERKR